METASALANDPRAKAVLAGIDTVLTYAPKIKKFIGNSINKLSTIHKNDQHAANFDYIKYAVDPRVDPNVGNMKPNNVPWAFARARATVQFNVQSQDTTSFAFACAPFSCMKSREQYDGKDW